MEQRSLRGNRFTADVFLTYAPNLAALRAFAFAASSSRLLAGA
jgi:hypothetical protein